MALISKEDREYIENKYHRQDEYFDPFNRLNYHGYEYDASTGLDDAEMRAALESLYEETKTEPHALAKAKGFAFVLDNARIDVPANDYFFGFYNWARPLAKTFINKWNDEVFDSMPDIKQLMRDYNASGTAELWLDTEHVVPYWIDILSLGFPGLLKRVKDYHKVFQNPNAEQEAFYRSIELEYEAILRLLCRLADYADGHKTEKSEFVAKALRNIEKGAPQNTFEALLVIYTYHVCSEYVDNYQARSLGNGLDRSLYAFYKRDMENGTFTKDQIKSFLAYFMLQYSAVGNYFGQPFYLCGTDFDDKTDISELTLLILEVYDKLNLYNPKIQVKIDFNTNPQIIMRVLKMIRAGHSSFVFCCLPGITKSLMSCYGVTEEEARNVDISGCNEMHIRGKESCMISALPNAAKAMEYVFTNGVDNVTGKQLGLKTGDVCDFKTFEEFYAAYLKQFTHMLDTIMDAARRYEKFVSQINPSVLLSATVESALQKGVDAYGFGLKYPTSSLLLCSFASTVDSILAVKELVFEKKETTLSELQKALQNNWEGYEELRAEALNAEFKYGNGNEKADLYAASFFRWFSVYVTGQKNSRGGVYKVGVPSTLHFISQGKVTMATPDGRKKGEEFSKNVAPVIGMERGGVTAMLRSALSTGPWLFSEAYVLDVMLHPSAVSGDDGLLAMKGLLDMYMKNDGISIQFNIFSSEKLRDAQAHPEKYKNLQVRVSGWNVLWNDLSFEEQEAYIKRAESIC